MKFKKEVQELFAKSGWYEGRNIKEEYDNLPRFDELPGFLKEFFYEYGGLIETYKHQPNEVTGVLDLTSDWAKEKITVDDTFYYGGGKVYGIGYYDLDNAVCYCNEEGRVFMISDAPTIMSEDFKEGVEKVIMEDYSNTKEWHFDAKEWKEEKF